MTRSLPKGWRRVRLGEVLEQVTRFEAVKPDGKYRLLGVRWYANGCHLHTETSGQTLRTKILSVVRSGDITYNKMWTSKGAFGVVQPDQDGFSATMEYPLFAVRDGMLSPDFLGEVFRQPKFWATARALCKGTTQRARLNPNDFLRLEIELPPLQEQGKISSALSAIYRAIRVNELVIARTRELKEALAHQLLTRGLPGRHKRFKDSAIGRIPAEWGVQPLSDLASVQTGLAKNKERHRVGTVEVPYLRVANVQDGYIDTEEIKRVKVSSNDVVRYSLRARDVLLTEGGDSDKLGRGCVWDGHISPCLHQNHIFAVRCRTNLLPQFLAFYAASRMGRQFFLSASKQTTNLASINSSQLKSLPVPCPTLSEQREIYKMVTVIERFSWRNLESLKLVGELAHNFSHALLGGGICFRRSLE